MKKIVIIIIIALGLSGCGNSNKCKDNEVRLNDKCVTKSILDFSCKDYSKYIEKEEE